MSRGAVLAAIAAAALLIGGAPASAAPGDVYVSDLTGPEGNIWRLGPGGGDAVSIASTSGFTPAGIAFDHSGNLLTGDFGTGNKVWLVNLGTGSITPFLDEPPISEPNDVAFAPDGSIIVSDRTGGSGGTPAVFRVDPVTREVTPIAAGSPPFDFNARGLAIKRDGTIFVADIDSIKQIAPNGDVTTLAGPSSEAFGGANGLALTPDERTLYVASFDSGGASNLIVRVDTATGQFEPFAELTDVMSVALLPDRSLLATDDNAGIVYRIGPSGSPISTFSDDPDLATGEIHDVLIEPARCAGRLPTVVGTTGSDILNGSPFADVFSALGGPDQVRSLAGADLVCGGLAADKLIGASGPESLLGNAGRDRLLGGLGTDRLLGGKQRDRLAGGKGRDRLVGGPGRDRLIGGPGRDRLIGGAGNDICVGGPGRDRQRSC